MDEDDLLTSMWPCYQYRPCHIEICHIHIHVKENNIIVWHRHDTFFVCFNGWNINTFIQSVNQLIFVVVTIFLFYIFRLMVGWLYSHCRQLLMLFLMSCEILKCIKKIWSEFEFLKYLWQFHFDILLQLKSDGLSGPPKKFSGAGRKYN